MSALEQLRDVPTPIRQWFGSEEVVDIIVELEQKFGLPDTETEIPDLLFDVEVKNLPLEQLSYELENELNLPTETAKALYADLKSRVFVPIAPELIAFGVGASELSLPVTSFERPLNVTPAPTAATPTPMPVAMPTPAISTPPIVAPRVSSQTVTLPKATPTPMPAPVSLYKDTVGSQTAVPTASIGRVGSGDVSGTVPTGPVGFRAARIDLGIQSSRVDDTLKSIFVQRETPKPQEIDYGASRPAPAPAIPAAPIASGAPVPLMDTQYADTAPPITPSVEVVNVPTSPETAPPPQGGLVDSLFRKVAPWHYAKFGTPGHRATDSLAAAPTINYSEEAAPPAPAPSAATPASDLPAPPKP